MGIYSITYYVTTCCLIDGQRTVDTSHHPRFTTRLMLLMWYIDGFMTDAYKHTVISLTVRWLLTVMLGAPCNQIIIYFIYLLKLLNGEPNANWFTNETSTLGCTLYADWVMGWWRTVDVSELFIAVHSIGRNGIDFGVPAYLNFEVTSHWLALRCTCITFRVVQISGENKPESGASTGFRSSKFEARRIFAVIYTIALHQ